MANNTSLIPNAGIASIMNAVMAQCRLLQQCQPDNQTIISIQGIKGSFSEHAAKQYAATVLSHSDVRLSYAVDSAQVTAELSASVADIGVMALHNSIGGLVDETLACLRKGMCRVIGLETVQVEQCLLAMSPLADDDIRHVYSHPQALSQCQSTLTARFPHARHHPVADTALAAQQLAEGLYDTSSAVIASVSCIKHYGVTLLHRGIQDHSTNETVFLIVQWENDDVSK